MRTYRCIIESELTSIHVGECSSENEAFSLIRQTLRLFIFSIAEAQLMLGGSKLPLAI